MRRLKVFGIGLGGPRGIVAATSQKRAVAILGVTLYNFQTFGCETGNKIEVDLAMASPKVVFATPGGYPQRYYRFAEEEDWWSICRRPMGDRESVAP